MSREILMLVDALAREKDVEREIVFVALEMALVSAARRLYMLSGVSSKESKDEFSEKGVVDIRAFIDRTMGSYEVHRRWLVVGDEELDDEVRQITLTQARQKVSDIEVGDYMEEPVDSLEFGRIGAQVAKHVIIQRMREAEKEQQVKDLVARSNGLISGVVRRLDKGNAVIECGRVEALLRRDQMIPKESLRVGDRVRAFLQKVEKGPRGMYIELSRTSPEFICKLFELEAPEIKEKIVEIKSAARDPGLRAKIAVYARDPRIDPVGVCVGVRGIRVQAVTQELMGERVDIVLWSSDPAQFVISALGPAEVSSITVDEENHAMDVVVDDSNLAISIGARGQNVRLASELTGWTINLMSVEEKQKKLIDENEKLALLFSNVLNIDQELAIILVEEGFASLESIAYLPVSDFSDIEGFDEELINELRARARNYLLAQAILKKESPLGEAGGNSYEGLLQLEGVDSELASSLTEKGITSRNDLADLSVDDLVDLVSLDREKAAYLIMKAREHWFTDTDME